MLDGTNGVGSSPLSVPRTWIADPGGWRRDGPNDAPVTAGGGRRLDGVTGRNASMRPRTMTDRHDVARPRRQTGGGLRSVGRPSVGRSRTRFPEAMRTAIRAATQDARGPGA